jgi:hypothetical protein
MKQPRLSFLLVSKLFLAGLLGYTVLLVLTAVGTVYFFPDFVSGQMDVTPNLFYEFVFTYYEFPVLIASPIMLVTSWSIFRFFGRRE